jgi:hypothetical protein
VRESSASCFLSQAGRKTGIRVLGFADLEPARVVESLAALAMPIGLARTDGVRVTHAVRAVQVFSPADIERDGTNGIGAMLAQMEMEFAPAAGT